MTDEPETKQRLQLISKAHESDVSKMKSMLKHEDMDEVTQPLWVICWRLIKILLCGSRQH